MNLLDNYYRLYINDDSPLLCHEYIKTKHTFNEDVRSIIVAVLIPPVWSKLQGTGCSFCCFSTVKLALPDFLK